ncbi:MAG: zinc ribbon domain-containing protein, partial [Candidatus Bathyarchaeota archaeon]|nr:zinc ribbon domain-containing protein [Candidatus Bathyarchaeota archaeon]
PLLMQEWAEIPVLIRKNQGLGKRKVKQVVTNQLGLVVKRLLELTEGYDAVFKLEDLAGLNKGKGAYSKFFYRKFLEILENKSLNVVKVDPAYTSQTCSRCGKIGKAVKRTFYCEKCYPKGFNRDINAAINIAKK